MNVDPLAILIPAVVSVVIALIEFARLRRTPRVQNAEAAKSLSDAASGLAKSYMTLYEDEKAKRVLLEHRAEQMETERNKALGELRELSEKLNRHLEDYSAMAIELQVAQKRIRDFESGASG